MMKVIYSIYNQVEKPIGELHFKLVLNKEDFVLVNQFPSERFFSETKVDKVYFPNMSGSNLIRKETEQFYYLFFKLEADKLYKKLEKTEKGEIVYWETKEYWLKKTIMQGTQSSLDILNKFITDIKGVMTYCKSQVPDEDSSCWNEEIEIKY